jgi:hypothetical protein
MATFKVTQARSQRMSFSGSDDQLKITWHADYFVDVTLSPGENISQIVAYDVLNADGVPVVNRSVYEVDNKIIPFVLCRSKSCRPHQDSYTRWIVEAQFESSIDQDEATNNAIAKPNSLTDITPRVVPILGETQKVLYQDKSDPPQDCARTPTGNWWNDPIIERIPTLTLQITQYESYLSYENLLERKFKVNASSYRSQPPYDWLIEDLSPTEVIVPLASGNVRAVQVTYTVVHSPHLYGWKTDRALIDTMFLETGGDKSTAKSFQNKEPGARSVGFITVTGAKRGDQSGSPEYIQYEAYDRIEFDDFLQA